MSQQSGGRYERSMAGMIGAMAVTIGVIVVFVVIRAVSRDDIQLEREPVDYLPVVAAFQEAGQIEVAYPPSLPGGWHAVGAGSTRDGWSMDIQTGDGEYIGIRQEKRILPDMLNEYVDPKPDEGDEVTLPGEFGPTWRTFSDDGGDYALAARIGKKQVLLVFGTAPADELKVFAGSLVATPLE